MERSYTFTLAEIREAAQWFWEQLGDAKVIALHGHMGAGKTTFVHACCDLAFVKDPVGSPTYALVNEYLSETLGIIYHIDLYRIRDEDEARDAGIEDVLYSGAICFVEWPEIAPGIFPDDTLHAKLEAAPGGERTIKLI